MASSVYMTTPSKYNAIFSTSDMLFIYNKNSKALNIDHSGKPKSLRIRSDFIPFTLAICVLISIYYSNDLSSLPWIRYTSNF